MIDVGDVVERDFLVTDANGAAAAAGAVACTVTLPDGTTDSLTVTNPSTGRYLTSFTPDSAGLHVLSWVATGDNADVHTQTVFVSAATALISVDEAKTFLNIDSTASDDELREFIDSATAIAEQWCGRPLARTVVTETHDGARGVIALRTAGVQSVAGVVESGVTLTSTDWALTPGDVLVKVSGTTRLLWKAGFRNVVVTLVAGVTGQDMVVARHGVRELLGHLWQTQRGSRRTSYVVDEPVPGMGYSLPPRVVQILEPIRTAGWA